MSNVGGSANINGILYQILGTLDRAMSIRLDNAVVSGEDITDARLIIEPTGGGGDLQYGSNSQRVIQQWKAKSRGGTWSLTKIVEEVLTDLYLAVPNEHLDIDCRYEFVTEGRRGQWDGAYELFQSLSKIPDGESFTKALSETTKPHRVGNSQLSDRELFEAIVSAVIERVGADREPDSLTRSKVRHLLSHFVMNEPLIQEQLATRVNEFLKNYVEHVEDVDGKRRELCGILLELSAVGGQSLTAVTLLEKANIPLYSFREWDRLQKRMHERLLSQVAKETYKTELDVREPPCLSEHVGIVTGESGQGKTWALAHLAIQASNDNRLGIWVPATRKDVSIPDLVSEEIWNYGLQRDAKLSLERVADRQMKSNHSPETPWASVYVDDVRSLDEAKYLLSLDWERWGIALMISMSPEFAERLTLSRPLPIIRMKDFDHEQLRAYLLQRELSWVQIAHDVRELIRRPVLAKIFADISETESEVNPQTEYDLMEAAWKQIADVTDIGLLRKLSGKIRGAKGSYPWLVEQFMEQGGSQEALSRLIKHGWLREAGDGLIAMWHGRFLCWAFAKYLVTQFQTAKLSLDALSEELRACYVYEPGTIPLGYVPMDVLWLLTQLGESEGQYSELWKLVAGLEAFGGALPQDETLYKDLLGSLGARAIPLILDRVAKSEEVEGNVLPKRAAEALLRIGRYEPEAISGAIRQCFGSSHQCMRELGLRLTIEFPRSIGPDRVWQIYCTHILSEKMDGLDYLKQELAARAFRLVAEQNLDWLQKRLFSVEDDEACFPSLVYALGNLGGNGDAREVWFKAKEHLFKVVPTCHRRCLIGCITNFLDKDEYSRLEEWAASEDEKVGGAAVWGLSYREPARSLRILKTVHARQLFGKCGHIGKSLMSTIPDELCQEYERLINDRPEDIKILIDLINGHGDRLTPSTVSAVLEWLELKLRESLNSSENRGYGGIHHPLSIVEGLHGENVLAELRRRRGSALEEYLLEIARLRISTINQFVDHEFEYTRHILKRMAGEGFTKLVNELISAEHKQLRMEGSELAVVRPDEKTLELLRGESLSDVMWSPNVSLVQMRAIDSMAALGEDAGLVRGILRWGLHISPEVGNLRRGHPPMTDDALRPALALLEEGEGEGFENAILAIGQSGRNEFAERIQDIYLGSALDSRLAKMCLLALDDLECDCGRILDRLIQQYRSGHHKFAALKVLGRSGVGTEVYLQLIANPATLDDMDERVVRFLANKRECREEIEPYVAKVIAMGRSLLRDNVDLLNPDQDTDRQQLWEQSLDPDRGFHVTGTKANAIQRLGTVAPEAAFEIGLESIQFDRRDRDSIPYVLVELDLVRATIELCDKLGTTNDKPTCAEVGRMFREYASPDLLRESIVGLLSSKDWRRRRVGAFISGFLPPAISEDELRKVAYSDPRWDVCSIAQHSLRSQQREAEAAKLVSTLQTLNDAEQWGTIDCILQLADPGILSLNSDPVGLRKFLKNQPYCIQKYTWDAVKKRREKVKKEMDTIHSRWKDD